jgi:hypothetical protein
MLDVMFWGVKFCDLNRGSRKIKEKERKHSDSSTNPWTTWEKRSRALGLMATLRTLQNLDRRALTRISKPQDISTQARSPSPSGFRAPGGRSPVDHMPRRRSFFFPSLFSFHRPSPGNGRKAAAAAAAPCAAKRRSKQLYSRRSFPWHLLWGHVLFHPQQTFLLSRRGEKKKEKKRRGKG